MNDALYFEKLASFEEGKAMARESAADDIAAARATGYEAATRDAVAWLREQLAAFDAGALDRSERLRTQYYITALERREHVGAGEQA